MGLPADAFFPRFRCIRTQRLGLWSYIFLTLGGQGLGVRGPGVLQG